MKPDNVKYHIRANYRKLNANGGSGRAAGGTKPGTFIKWKE